MPRTLSGLRVLASEFDDFLVDLWGVVHDGERPFEGVIAALEALSDVGDRRVVFVTNTSRTGDVVRDTLVNHMSIDRALFHDVVSSGDVTRAALLGRDPAVFGHVRGAARCFHLGDPSFVPWLFEMGLAFVDELGDADIVIATGATPDHESLAATRQLLAPGVARGVPLVCTNPDRVIPRAGVIGLGPGAVAYAYAELGGRVVLYGKPHPPIYREARTRLGAGSTRRIVAIGDLLATDIRGAQAAGIPAVLVTTTGAHAAELGSEPSLSEPSLEALFARENVEPDMVIDRFAW